MRLIYNKNVFKSYHIISLTFILSSLFFVRTTRIAEEKEREKEEKLKVKEKRKLEKERKNKEKKHGREAKNK